jgi:ATP-binding cassette subfamily C (CFTR/MRP) protein 1
MGEEFNADRYRHAVEVAQLLPDLAMLPNGDATEIGDRGVTLSGGQKQRVSIARAVYANADVYLLDDPLSAVDSHVGRALFEQVICGALRGKTIVLVTNALHYLPAADQVLWMDGGVIKGKGTYQQLTEQGLNIAELVHMEDDESDAESDIDDGVVGGLRTGLVSTEEEISSEEEGHGAVNGHGVRTAVADGQRSSEESSREGSHSADGAAAVIPPVQSSPSSAVAAAAAGEAPPAAGSTALAVAAAAADGVVLKVKRSTSSTGGGARAPSYRNMRKAGTKSNRHVSVTSQVGSYTPSSPAPNSLSMVRLAAEANRNLTGVEERQQGRVKGVVLWAYVAAAGGIIIAAIIIIMFAAEQAARVLTDTWLGFWTSNAFQQTMWFYVGLYAALGLGYSLITFIRSLTFLNVTVNAALNLHNQLLGHILRLPKTFFDTNPAGRILNRWGQGGIKVGIRGRNLDA